MAPPDTTFRTRLLTLLDLSRLATRERKARYQREYRKTHHYLNVGIENDQYTKIIAPRAQAAGITPTEYLREAAFAYSEKRFLVPQDLEAALWAVSDQLAALGNNLNQIARHANLEQAATRQDISDARRLLEQAGQAVERAVRFPSGAA